MNLLFVECVKERHLSGCLWLITVCDQSFTKLSLDRTLMCKQLFENIKTWLQKNDNSCYILPKIDPEIKQKILNKWMMMMMTITDDDIPPVIDIIILACCGWSLKPLISNHPSIYIQCRYCNRCICIQSHSYHTKVLLFETNLSANDTSNDVPLMNKLRNLNFKSNVLRSHSLNIFPTQALQTQATFNANERVSVWPKKAFLFYSSPNSQSKKRQRSQMQNEFEINDDIVVEHEHIPIWKKRRLLSNSGVFNHVQKKRGKKRTFDTFVNQKREEMEDEKQSSVCDPPPNKKMKFMEVNIDNHYFQPILEHKNECPFVCSLHIEDNEIVIGWQYCLKILPENVVQCVKQIIQNGKNIQQ